MQTVHLDVSGEFYSGFVGFAHTAQYSKILLLRLHVPKSGGQVIFTFPFIFHFLSLDKRPPLKSYRPLLDSSNGDLSMWILLYLYLIPDIFITSCTRSCVCHRNNETVAFSERLIVGETQVAFRSYGNYQVFGYTAKTELAFLQGRRHLLVFYNISEIRNA